jgi:hypothetical protein
VTSWQLCCPPKRGSCIFLLLDYGTTLVQRHFRSLVAIFRLVGALWVVWEITSIRKKFDLFLFWQIVRPEHQFVVFRCCKFYLGYFWSSRRPFWASCFCQHAHFYCLYSSRMLHMPSRLVKEVMRADGLWWSGWSCTVWNRTVNIVFRLRNVNL